MARHFAEAHEAAPGGGGLPPDLSVRTSSSSSVRPMLRELAHRLQERSSDAAAAVRAPHHQLHHLRAVPAIRPRLQAELDRAGQAVPLEGSHKREAPCAQAGGHTLPVRCGLAPLERQDEADRSAALDRVHQQLDQLILLPGGLVRVEHPNDDQLAGAAQAGRPRSGRRVVEARRGGMAARHQAVDQLLVVATEPVLQRRQIVLELLRVRGPAIAAVTRRLLSTQANANCTGVILASAWRLISWAISSDSRRHSVCIMRMSWRPARVPGAAAHRDRTCR